MPSQALLPVAAAAGGVVVPALFYLAFNADPSRARTAGRCRRRPTSPSPSASWHCSVARSRRTSASLLLALAIIDDVIAVLIIAFFYSGGLDPAGTARGGRRRSDGHRVAADRRRRDARLCDSGAVIWCGLLMTGAHPTLAGVVLGLMTPVRSRPTREDPVDVVSRVAETLRDNEAVAAKDGQALARPLRQLDLARREILPPVVRVQATLHPGSPMGSCPVCAGQCRSGPWRNRPVEQRLLARPLRRGARPGGRQAVGHRRRHMAHGEAAVRPVARRRFLERITLVGLLGGVGFTMSIFIAMLAYRDDTLSDRRQAGCAVGIADRRRPRPRLGCALQSPAQTKPPRAAAASAQNGRT